MKIVVDNVDKIRLDKYLSLNTDFSRALIEKMINDGFVLVNEENVKNSYIVKLNDEILIDETYNISTEVKPEKMDLNIVYEDDDVMVINKPSGLVVHPGSGNFSNTLVNGLMYYSKNLSNITDAFRVGIVHRIDKDTSGLMLVCKTNRAHEILAEDFKNHNVKRTYVALLCGTVPFNEAVIDAPIKRNPNIFNKMGVYKDGKKAITNLKVLKRYQKYTLCEFKLETGRTHQIRVHAEYIGFPIYNDPVYNKKEATEFGQFLHSKEVTFTHPITKQTLHFECELPKEFNDFLQNLD